MKVELSLTRNTELFKMLAADEGCETYFFRQVHGDKKNGRVTVFFVKSEFKITWNIFYKFESSYRMAVDIVLKEIKEINPHLELVYVVSSPVQKSSKHYSNTLTIKLKTKNQQNDKDN